MWLNRGPNSEMCDSLASPDDTMCQASNWEGEEGGHNDEDSLQSNRVGSSLIAIPAGNFICFRSRQLYMLPVTAQRAERGPRGFHQQRDWSSPATGPPPRTLRLMGREFPIRRVDVGSAWTRAAPSGRISPLHTLAPAKGHARRGWGGSGRQREDGDAGTARIPRAEKRGLCPVVCALRPLRFPGRRSRVTVPEAAGTVRELGTTGQKRPRDSCPATPLLPVSGSRSALHPSTQRSPPRSPRPTSSCPSALPSPHARRPP